MPGSLLTSVDDEFGSAVFFHYSKIDVVPTHEQYYFIR